VLVAGPFESGDPGTTGVDSEALAAALPANYDGGIWTNNIDIIAPVMRASRR
jgi:glycerophosphoryl diester phosphodiesterase